jgi:hypothetical protein
MPECKLSVSDKDNKPVSYKDKMCIFISTDLLMQLMAIELWVDVLLLL